VSLTSSPCECLQRKVICIFDCDDKDINSKHKDKIIKNWGNKVLSFVLPNLDIGSEKGISIEFFYTEKQITTKDKLGRRLFFSDEFNLSGLHKRDPNLVFGRNPVTGYEIPGWKKTLAGDKKIIDDGVFYIPSGKSVALTKINFAKCIFHGEEGFSQPDFSLFKKIFYLIKSAAG
jgi:hypothetical protein